MIYTMAITKESFFETDALRKAREDYKEILERRAAIERELGEIGHYFAMPLAAQDRRGELLMQYAVVKATQEEMRDTVRRESDKAFGEKAKTATTRLEALECLYRVLTRYLCYQKGINGQVDPHKLDQYWAAVVFTAAEVSRFNKTGNGP